MAVCLSSLIFVGFPVRFHWTVSGGRGGGKCKCNSFQATTEFQQ